MMMKSVYPFSPALHYSFYFKWKGMFRFCCDINIVCEYIKTFVKEIRF